MGEVNFSDAILVVQGCDLCGLNFICGCHVRKGTAWKGNYCYTSCEILWNMVDLICAFLVFFVNLPALDTTKARGVQVESGL